MTGLVEARCSWYTTKACFRKEFVVLIFSNARIVVVKVNDRVLSIYLRHQLCKISLCGSDQTVHQVIDLILEYDILPMYFEGLFS